MTKRERQQRKQYLPNGLKGLEDMLAVSNGGVSPVKVRQISMIINGDRGDRHGVLELFREVTDKERKRREMVAKELSKHLLL